MKYLDPHTKFEYSFTDADVVNIEDYESRPYGPSYPPSGHAWLIHEHGFVLAVVFASSLRDAIDIAVDADKLNQFLIEDGANSDYWDIEKNDWREDVSFLGNASEPFDIESLEVVALPNPPLSFCALLKAHLQGLSVSRSSGVVDSLSDWLKEEGFEAAALAIQNRFTKK